jgi:hypothetical protein
MNRRQKFQLPRRSFLASTPALFLGSRLWGVEPYGVQPPQTVPELKEEPTAEELKWIEKSAMAKDLNNYFGKGYSCAESLLIVSLRFLEKPEELVWAASGFGGGMYHRDLCGFLTAGIMALGVKAGMLEKARKEAKKDLEQAVKQYWKWWTSLAPLHCTEIRKPETSSKVCVRLGRLAAAKTEELLTSFSI